MGSYFYFGMICLFSMGIVWPLVFRSNEENRNYVAHGMAAAGSLAAVLCAIFIFMQGLTTIPLFGWPWLGSVGARLDYLAAWFLLLTGIVGMSASVYAVGYCREYYGHRLGLLTAGLNAFLLSMALVFTVDHVVAFLMAWEAMTLVSFLLVNADWEEPENRRAAYLYLVMTQVATAFLIAALLLLAENSGGFEYNRLRQASIQEGMAGIIFVLAFIGLATKAGLVPVHIWLPEAHPAAPSHISALMSGVMIKAAVYAFCRIVLEFLPVLPVWYGGLILVVAVLTCILGVLYALMENNIKKLLAYSSIENMGIIFLGLGAGMVLLAQGKVMLAGMAWTAALFHMFNHGLFKSLLFFGAGTVIRAVHSQDIEKMGGLIKTMPYTAMLFAFGSAAIAALPFSNGFVSEWLTFQTLFDLTQSVVTVGAKIGSALLIAALGITGALGATCFVKAFGFVFLAKPRSAAAITGTEGTFSMMVPMAGLAALCLAIGFWPSPALQLISQVIGDFPRLTSSEFSDDPLQGALVGTSSGDAMPALPFAMALVLLSLLVARVLVRFGGLRRIVSAGTWTCGIIPDARMEYTATGFSKPVRVAFGSLLGFRRSKMIQHSDNLYYGQRIAYDLSIRHLITEEIYKPVSSWIIASAKVLRRLQNGSLRLYIGYILVVTVIALIWSSR